MKEFLVALVVILVILFVAAKAKPYLVDDRVTIAASDGRHYKVRDTQGKRETAEALARLNRKMATFIRRLLADADVAHRTMALRIQKRYNPDRISEGRIDPRFTSYTVNKGEEVVLCMRSRDRHDRMYDDNLLFYVALHELAHISSITEDHSPEFHENFRYLLHKASTWNMFYRVHERFHYCGMDVDGM